MPEYELRELKSVTNSRVWKDFTRVSEERLLQSLHALETGVMPGYIAQLIEKNAWTPREADFYLRGQVAELRYMLNWPEATKELLEKETPDVERN